MRKLLALLAVLILTVGLVACGDDNDTEEPATEPEETEQDTDGEEADEDESADDESEEVADGEFAANEKINEVLTLLDDNGFEVSNVIDGNLDVVGSTDGIMAEINGDDLFLFEAVELEEGHENIDQVQNDGEVTMEFEGQQGEVPAWGKGNYVFLLAEGHEDYEEIVELIENEFDAE